VAGRVANRRVVIVILAGEGAPAPSDAAGIAKEANDAGATVALPPIATGAVDPVTAVPGESASAGTEPAPVPALTTGAGIPAQE